VEFGINWGDDWNWFDNPRCDSAPVSDRKLAPAIRLGFGNLWLGWIRRATLLCSRRYCNLERKATRARHLCTLCEYIQFRALRAIELTRHTTMRELVARTKCPHVVLYSDTNDIRNALLLLMQGQREIVSRIGDVFTASSWIRHGCVTSKTLRGRSNAETKL
jgi:hypothetical protein